MPSKNYSSRLGRYYNSPEEKKELDREYDNRLTKINWWSKKWRYDLNITDYDEFSKHSKQISKIKNIHDFFCKFDKNNIKTEQELFMYGKFCKQIEFAWESRHYIRTLKKINGDALLPPSESDCSSTSEEV
tara:strand:+ start:759 stop:1151 length:393 start_codon:yes stop_codon:yes gene_type:complete